jgi:hypothetical protein
VTLYEPDGYGQRDGRGRRVDLITRSASGSGDRVAEGTASRSHSGSPYLECTTGRASPAGHMASSSIGTARMLRCSSAVGADAAGRAGVDAPVAPAPAGLPSARDRRCAAAPGARGPHLSDLAELRPASSPLRWPTRDRRSCAWHVLCCRNGARTSQEIQREDAIARRCEMTGAELPELWEWAEYY